MKAKIKHNLSDQEFRGFVEKLHSEVVRADQDKEAPSPENPAEAELMRRLDELFDRNVSWLVMRLRARLFEE